MKTSSHKDIYNRVKSVLLERFPKEALYINDAQETIFLDGMHYFDYRCRCVLILSDNFYGRDFVYVPKLKYYLCEDRVETYQSNGKPATNLTQYDTIKYPTIEQINKICDDIIFEIKKIKYEIALSKIKEDF